MRIRMIDAQTALGFVIAQAAIIEPQVYATRYPDIQYPGLIPVDFSGHPFATTVVYFSSDRFGKAGWINGSSDDIPMAGTNRSKFETMVHTAAIGYGFGFEEIGRARMMGIDLPGDDAAAARRAYEEMVDEVMLYGDATKNFHGLLDNPLVTAAAATNGDWDNPTTTGKQIVQDMNNAMLNVFNGTNTVSMADTLLLPWSKYLTISTKAMNEYSDMTVLEWFLKNNVYTAQTGRAPIVRGLRGLDTIGESGLPRLVAYRRSPEVMKAHIPMPLQFQAPWQAGPLRVEVPGVFRLGGLDIRLPKEVVYMDGI